MTSAEMEEEGISVMPASLQEALKELKACPISKDTLGGHIYDKYIIAKEKEWDSFRTAVTDWELKEYLTAY